MERNTRMDAIGESEVFLNFQQSLSLAAKVNRPVLLIGERGTGKELAASRVHYLSKRWNEPFVTLNCSALSPSLIESELFGHEAGSFTGAGKLRKGRFEEADGGTLFLDEIGLIPLEVQEKILRVVEYGSFERVGSSRTVEVNVRIIGATNEDLPSLCEAGKFKRDLLDRLAFEVLFLPPLRKRRDDLLLLASHFATRMVNEMGLEGIVEFSDEVSTLILDYSWPGNVRELKNAVERAVYRGQASFIEALDLDPFFNPHFIPESTPVGVGSDSLYSQEDYTSLPLKDAVRKLEQALLVKALEENRFNQKKAASQMGLTYDQFRGLYRKYQEDNPTERD